MIVLVDQDGVLADFERAFLDVWRREHPESFYVPLEDRRSFYMRDEYPEELREEMHAVHVAEGFYRELPPIEGAVEALQEMLQEGHEVYICTSPLTSSRYCASEKLEWVHEHLGKAWLKRTVIASDKTLVVGDVLIFLSE